MTSVYYWLLTLGSYALTVVQVVVDTVRDTLPRSRDEADAFLSGLIYMALLCVACLVVVSWMVRPP